MANLFPEMIFSNDKKNYISFGLYAAYLCFQNKITCFICRLMSKSSRGEPGKSENFEKKQKKPKT